MKSGLEFSILAPIKTQQSRLTYISRATSGMGMSSLMETVFFRGLGLAGVLELLGWLALAAATEGGEMLELQPNTPQLPPAAWGFKLIHIGNKS